MGAVYLAERDDQQYDRRVAIKVLPAGLLSGGLRTRFLLERRILASLEHPDIARLYDAGMGEGGTPYFAIEYVEGRRIDVHCDEHRLPIRGPARALRSSLRRSRSSPTGTWWCTGI